MWSHFILVQSSKVWSLSDFKPYCSVSLLGHIYREFFLEFLGENLSYKAKNLEYWKSIFFFNFVYSVFFGKKASLCIFFLNLFLKYTQIYLYMIINWDLTVLVKTLGLRIKLGILIFIRIQSWNTKHCFDENSKP